MIGTHLPVHPRRKWGSFSLTFTEKQIKNPFLQMPFPQSHPHMRILPGRHPSCLSPFNSFSFINIYPDHVAPVIASGVIMLRLSPDQTVNRHCSSTYAYGMSVFSLPWEFWSDTLVSATPNTNSVNGKVPKYRTIFYKHINSRYLEMGIKKLTPYFLADFWQLYTSIYIYQEKNSEKKKKKPYTLWAVFEDLVRFC